MSHESRKSVVVVNAADLERTLRVSRSEAYRLMKLAGAVRVGERSIRLSVTRLAAFVGADLAAEVARQAKVDDSEEAGSP